MDLITKADAFAAEKHKAQTRKNAARTPYIVHPRAVAKYISKVAGITDANVICAALLHDTVEDTGTSLQEIETEFGPKVAAIVMEVTDDKSLPKAIRKQAQIEHAVHISNDAKLVKLADKLDNLTDLANETPQGWSPQIVQGYFVWSHFVVANLRGTNAALEKALDEVFAKVIPSDLDLSEALQSYYSLLK